MSRPRPDGLSSLLSLARRAARDRRNADEPAPPGFAARVVAGFRRQGEPPEPAAAWLRLRLWWWGAGIATAACLVAGVVRMTSPGPDLTAAVMEELRRTSESF